MATVTISKAEIERMKASVLPSVENKYALERKAELKKKSDEKLKNWPNTLEALRIKKENAIVDRERVAELQRQEIDREVVYFFYLKLFEVIQFDYIRKLNFVGICVSNPFKRQTK